MGPSAPRRVRRSHPPLDSKSVDAYVVQVIIAANHMNGKDTHVRGLKILGPTECVPTLIYAPFALRTLILRSRRKLQPHEEPFPFINPRFKMYECIR